MNASLLCAVVSLSVLGLAGCAGMQERRDSGYVAPQRTPTTLDSDARYIAEVERIARIRGIDLVWVHAPRKRFVSTTAVRSDD